MVPILVGERVTRLIGDRPSLTMLIEEPEGVMHAIGVSGSTFGVEGEGFIVLMLQPDSELLGDKGSMCGF